jgi:hypothetical protein
MLLQEQSCDVPAFTYCTVVLPAATSRPPSSTFHYNHIDTYRSVEYVTAFQHIQNLSSINPLLMWHTNPKEHGCVDFKQALAILKHW